MMNTDRACEPRGLASKVDLHVHSKHSDRPSEWFLRRIGAPESFVEPLELYRRARAAGMDFVTISDHNCIRGALEIAHLDGTFLSSEITTYFPEDRCKIHFLCWGFSEEQFARIDELRTNIYELRGFVLQERIPHAVAHPFFRVNEKLTPWHVERLLLLFNCFEGLNGARDRRASELVNSVFRNLTPAWIERTADVHRIAPVGVEPWRKSFTGGSDDHGGLYIASAFTVTPQASSVDELLDHLRNGACELAGRAGSSLRLAHSFYEIGYQYYRRRFGEVSRHGPDLIGELFEGLVGRQRQRTVRSRVRGAVGKVVQRRRSEGERRLIEELLALAASESSKGRAGQEWRTYERASRMAHLLGFSFAKRFAEGLSEGKLIDAFQSFSALAPVALGIAPYLASFATQHKDNGFLGAIERHFQWARAPRAQVAGCAWLTDTFNDVNGVAKMIQTLGRNAHERDLPLEVLTCEAGASSHVWQKSFRPVGTFPMPEYEVQRLAFPPFLDVLEHVESRGYKEIILSTPGPMGLVGLMAGKLLGLRMVGIYHTDFPAYVEEATENEGLAAMVGNYMAWFYEQMHHVLVPTEVYRESLLAMGIEDDRIGLLQRGVDAALFNPERRVQGFWDRYGLSSDEDGVVLLYVGRLAREKNLQFLLDEVKGLIAQGLPVRLGLVGEGPQGDELRRYAAGCPGIAFTGVLEGEELAVAYASADLFVFPSTTDTFGNVVLEAMASGLPAVVTDQGGPQELVEDGVTGSIASVTEPGAFGGAIARLIADRQRRANMGRRARLQASELGWQSVLDDLLQCSADDAGGFRALEPAPCTATPLPEAQPGVAVSSLFR